MLMPDTRIATLADYNVSSLPAHQYLGTTYIVEPESFVMLIMIVFSIPGVSCLGVNSCVYAIRVRYAYTGLAVSMQ